MIDFYPNSTLEFGKPSGDSPFTVVPLPEATGVETNQVVDMATVRLRLIKGDQRTEEIIASQRLRTAPKVDFNDTTYRLHLRFKRHFKPYTLTLLDLRHDVYPGTDRPKNFQSDVRLVDHTTGEQLEYKIYMNNPMRYRGETFYQHQMRIARDNSVLQVVNTPGWLIPYIACGMITVGLLVHFFLSPQPLRSEGLGIMKPSHLIATITTTVLTTLFIVSMTMRSPAPPEGFDLTAAGKLPVVMGGRPKPLDSVARNTMRFLSDREYYVDADGKKRQALQWLLDVMTLTRSSQQIDAENFTQALEALNPHIIRIQNLEVLQTVGLERRKRFRYAVQELVPKWNDVYEQARLADEVPTTQRSVYQNKILELATQLFQFNQIANLEQPMLIPPATETSEWMSLTLAAHSAQMGGPSSLPATYWNNILAAYHAKDAPAFNAAVAEYHAELQATHPKLLAKTSQEAFFNRVSPFGLCSFLCVVIVVLNLVGLLIRKPSLVTSANTLAILVLVVWLVGFLARMHFQDRLYVFVTNLYSSALFVGWGILLTALIVEGIFKLRIGAALGGIAGFITLLIAANLGADGDTMEMMQAVLDTNFWLSTHVTTVALGYSLTYMAGALGIVYIIAGVFFKNLDSKFLPSLNKMTYGVICAALLLSFVGTVLGGIWADQSWGRFWGWDVKENGALIIVLWNAMILHARWGGIARARGIAILAVAGNIVTSWSWFGVNMLNVGLHSYGPMESGALKLALFVISQLLVIGIGMMPASQWAANQNNTTPTPQPKD